MTIDDPFVEGLVRIDALSDDYYTFDEPACRLVGRRSGRAFALGDSVQVEVQSVSVVRRKIDFALAGHATRHRARDFQRGDKRRRDGRRRGGARARRGREGRGPPPRRISPRQTAGPAQARPDRSPKRAGAATAAR